jgi:hypothetical protein
MNVEYIPKSSGVYNLERSGIDKNAIIWAMSDPLINVEISFK